MTAQTKSSGARVRSKVGGSLGLGFVFTSAFTHADRAAVYDQHEPIVTSNGEPSGDTPACVPWKASKLPIHITDRLMKTL